MWLCVDNGISCAATGYSCAATGFRYAEGAAVILAIFSTTCTCQCFQVKFVYPVRLPVSTVWLREIAVWLPVFVVRITVFVVRPSFHILCFSYSLCPSSAQVFYPWICAG